MATHTANTADSPQALAELAAYLFTRRESILNKWRSACEQDPTLGRVSALSREEFNNLLPLVLNILEERILNKPSEVDATTTAQAHGLHRWHKAHGLMDTLHELNHLTQTLFSELRLFGQLFPRVERDVLLDVQQHISGLMQETIDGSVAKYDKLQRLQATNRANTLQQAVDQMAELSQQRGDVLRQSTHDLRGSFGIINSAAYLLKDEGLSEPERQQFVDMLSRNLGTVQTMLTSLMDLSRLEAGQEPLQIESFDAAGLLQEMVASAQPVAAERNIILQADGPPSLMVKTDRIKLQRIVQNLLLNALKYTRATPQRTAIVAVSWSVEGDYRWVFSIQDSGPGLPPTTVGTLGQQLKPTVEPTSVLGPDQSEPVAVLPDDLPPIPAPADMDASTRPTKGGEGVGLQIVKRLCELLDANLDVESKAGRGTLFRIRMPIHPTV
ncbi:sensor histidine kinase [Spirosoma pollinicola]|uniref:histidine kinase n=1 Tax=Spirosoma pollinicola TaxID=2057025 RepID=A0A2K8YW16_9BACT|nr:HAMP domain-containing sensor histidine kinase [Spirosoma pollinicola]AUD01817.1 sensor histidine kinase [Spirosoma pollinicola]